jgi:multidrug efflux pump subunit AcrA (membrane-fusion protein)
MRAALVAAAFCAAAGCDKGQSPLGGEKKPSFRFAPIVRSDIVRTVEATGTITPRNTSSGIPVGAQVNGRIVKLFVDYNSVVTNGQVVALIDPQVYEANHKSALAQLHVNEANVKVREAAILSARAEHALAEKTFAEQRIFRAALDTSRTCHVVLVLFMAHFNGVW